MAVYWLLFVFPALMALAYPAQSERGSHGAGQKFGFAAFILLYSLIGLLRFETGGDWETYMSIFDEIRIESLSFALTRTDPLYGLINWISAWLGTDIYLVNGVCCAILGWGVVAVSRPMRDPWLALTMSVPYLLIVVGMGYVRQGAAIGLMLGAIASLDRSKTSRSVLLLILSALMHSTAVLAFPAFAWTFVRRNKAIAVFASLLLTLAFMFLLLPQLARLEQGYVESEYDSEGTFVRILMGLLPAAVILVRWRAFAASERVRSVWLLIAGANFLALAALFLAASSTAVDRITLFFSVIQLVAFGEFRSIAGISTRMVLLSRLALIAVAAVVQVVWLVYAAHAWLWVPYKSIFDSL